MNIFFLDKNPVKAAQYHNDKHCVKMILETAQILSTNCRFITNTLSDPNSNLYKATHTNHPSTVWARQSYNNAHWTYSLGIALLDEYKLRYGKVHKSSVIFQNVLPYLQHFPSGELSLPALAMPEELHPLKYTSFEQAVFCYRKYYMVNKVSLANWKTSTPDWFKLNTL